MKVVAIVPAHNEEENIERVVHDLLRQTFPLEKIIVIADNCTDSTAEKVMLLEKSFPKVRLMETKDNLYRKAGAINVVLEILDEEKYELVLIMDSDSRIAPNLLEEAVKSFREDPLLGGVCSTAEVLKPKARKESCLRKMEKSFLWTLQRLEYAGFDAERTATWKCVTIIHGLCGVYRLRVLKDVGGYALGHLLEDYDLTLRIKEGGWHARFNPRMRAKTEVPLTLKSFFKQRLRWLRGGVDVLMEHGLNRFTAEDYLHHFIFIVLFISIFWFVALSSLYGGWAFRFNPHPLPIAVVIVGYLLGIYKLWYVKNIKVSDITMRLVVLPELVIAVSMMVVRVYAYYLAFFGRPQKW